MRGRALHRRTARTTGRPGPSAEVIRYQAALRAALRKADRACCCPAQPVVAVVVPTAPTAGEPAELLLCGHHYRASRHTLARLGALVVDTGGEPARPSLRLPEPTVSRDEPRYCA